MATEALPSHNALVKRIWQEQALKNMLNSTQKCCHCQEYRNSKPISGLVDITQDPDFNGIYDEDMNEDPTYDPNSPEEKARLQQRLYLQKKVIQKHFEKKKEIRKGIGYLKLICFLVPFLLSLEKKMKIPYLSSLLQPFSDDKVKTERELPPFIYGRDFKCQNFHYKENQYFHVHGGIEFDITTPSIENALDDFKVYVIVVSEMVCCFTTLFLLFSNQKELLSI
ncbi:ankyrin and armadillo repeat-containing protein-like isoform X2 [Heterocephalus glaber]|nr:ankyrin and armadillo repeat-containing protein-like isoform X2 [Heterocephalus glaber]